MRWRKKRHWRSHWRLIVRQSSFWRSCSMAKSFLCTAKAEPIYMWSFCFQVLAAWAVILERRNSQSKLWSGHWHMVWSWEWQDHIQPVVLNWVEVGVWGCSGQWIFTSSCQEECVCRGSLVCMLRCLLPGGMSNGPSENESEGVFEFCGTLRCFINEQVFEFWPSRQNCCASRVLWLLSRI